MYNSCLKKSTDSSRSAVLVIPAILCIDRFRFHNTDQRFEFHVLDLNPFVHTFSDFFDHGNIETVWLFLIIHIFEWWKFCVCSYDQFVWNFTFFFLLHPVNSIDATVHPANATVKNFFIICSPFNNNLAFMEFYIP